MDTVRKMGIRTVFAVLAAALVVLVFAAAGTALANEQTAYQSTSAEEAAEALAAGAEWLASAHQNEDGGFSSFSVGVGIAPSDVGGSVDALLALSAAGVDNEPLLNYLKSNVQQALDYAALSRGAAGKLNLALIYSGLNPRNFEGFDLVDDLDQTLTETVDYTGVTPFDQSLAILSLAAAGETAPEASVDWLLSVQSADGPTAGSWDDGYGTVGNPDATAMSLLALSTAEHPGTQEALAEGIGFLYNAQLDSGGWEYGEGFGENANSTALVVQALLILGEDITSEDSIWIKGGFSPLDVLLSWQGESGAFQADYGEGRFDDFFSTAQSLPALAAARDLTDVNAAAAQPEAAATAPSPTSTHEPTPMPTSEPTAEPTIDSGSSDEAAVMTETELQVEDDSEPSESEADSQSGVSTAQDEQDGGLSFCNGAFALPLMIGLAIVLPLRRRKR